jgi:hypothetical protein
MQLQANDIPLGKTETVKQNRTNCGGSKSTTYVAQNLQPWKNPLLVPILRKVNHVHVPHPISLRSILILFSNLYLKLRIDLIPRSYQAKTVNTPL